MYTISKSMKLTVYFLNVQILYNTHTISKCTKTEQFIFKIVLFQYKTCTISISVQKTFLFILRTCTISLQSVYSISILQCTSVQAAKYNGRKWQAARNDIFILWGSNYYIRVGGICTISYMLHSTWHTMEPSSFTQLYEHTHK